MIDNQLLFGNSAVQPSVDGDTCEFPTLRHPLVEEAISISLADLRRLFGRAALLKAVEDARPISIRIQRNIFFIYLVSEPRRLISRRLQVSDREVSRLWLWCMGCRRKARKLFTYERFPGSSVLYMPLCRACHGLTYQSQNCGGNKWWREIAMPIKRLLRRRERLMARKPSAKIAAQVDLLDQSIHLLRQRAAPKACRKHPNSNLELGHVVSGKRRYRDLALILRSLPC